MKRIALFIVTNLAVVLVMSVMLSLLGFEGFLDAQGVDLKRLFMSHPPLHERIAVLRAGG